MAQQVIDLSHDTDSDSLGVEPPKPIGHVHISPVSFSNFKQMGLEVNSKSDTVDMSSQSGAPAAGESLQEQPLVNKGRVARRRRGRKAFEFKKLPAEVRNIIYEFALVPEGRITIVKDQDSCYSTRENPFRAKVGKKLYSTVCTPAILRIDKDTWCEASSMLVRDNSFRFRSVKVLHAFLSKFPQLHQQLRDIELSAFSNGFVAYTDHSRRVYTDLSLERLHINYHATARVTRGSLAFDIFHSIEWYLCTGKHTTDTSSGSNLPCTCPVEDQEARFDVITFALHNVNIRYNGQVFPISSITAAQTRSIWKKIRQARQLYRDLEAAQHAAIAAKQAVNVAEIRCQRLQETE